MFYTYDRCETAKIKGYTTTALYSAELETMYNDGVAVICGFSYKFEVHTLPKIMSSLFTAVYCRFSEPHSPKHVLRSEAKYYLSCSASILLTS